MKENPDRSGGEDGALENGLPQPFVESMRTLFDILDDQHMGRVKFSDIERSWHEDEDCSTSGLPPGVLESLRVVTPQDGYLSFSRFCKGLQICLLRSKSGNPGMTPTSLASSAQSSPSSSGETSKPSDFQRTSGNRITGREEVPPPIPPPPSHQAYQAPPPPLPYIAHSQKNPDFNGNRKPVNPNHTSTGWSQKSKTSVAPSSAGLYGGSNTYDVKKSVEGPIYEQHTSLSNNKYHMNGFSHHNDAGREGHNNNGVLPTPKNANFSGGISSEARVSSSKNGSKTSSGSSLSSNETSNNSRPGFGGQTQKSDVRMGTGGVMYGNKGASSSNSYPKSSHSGASFQGPPKPPRSLESQSSDGNLNASDKFNNKPNGTLNQQARHSNTSHRVDSIINKMEALSTYGTSANTNNSNIHKEKIYDTIASKNRRAAAPVTSGFYASNNSKSSSSSSQTHPYRKDSVQTRHEDSHYDHWSSDRVKRGSSKPSGGSSSSNGSRAPAALPLSAVLNGYSLQRSQTHSHISTHSLERDSRADARRVSQEADPGNRVRSRRGGSLERLLDDHNNHQQYFHHHNGSAPRHYHHHHHHHHSRESSTDTSSTAPLHSYHSSADWSVAAPHPPSSSSLTSTSSSANAWNVVPPSTTSLTSSSTWNSAQPSMSNKSTATFSQRFQHPKEGAQYPTAQQPTRNPSHQPPTSPARSNPTNTGAFVGNLAPNTSHKSSAAVKYSVPTSSTSADGSPRRNGPEARQSSVGTRPATGAGPTTSGPVDNRLTMSSYAWIRGGEDTSSNSGDGGYHSSGAGFGGGPAAPAPLPSVPLAPESTEAGGGSGSSRGHKKSRRRDARRHTLQNGLDYAVVRRAGELEAERDMLHQGLQVVEQARQWYRTQLHNLLYNLHHNTHSVQPYDSEAQQQKLHYQLARITEINSQLTALMSASDMPHHLALASSTATAPPADGSSDKQDKNKIQGQVKRLKDQNQQLTEEVSMKSQHISVLEQDKSRLLRELFQARTVSTGNLQSSGQADSTFM